MTDDKDPFAGVARSMTEGNTSAIDARPESKSGAAAKSKGEWVSPVPDDAPTAKPSHNAHGRPVASWQYRDCDGRLIHHVCRFEKADGSKEVLPQTLWRDGQRLYWRWAAAPVPRPLYGLDRLAKQPNAPVLIVEGEKTADAAAELFPAFAVVTWSGGSKAVTKTDWSPLFRRRCVILPDSDTPGREAAPVVRKAVLAKGAEGAEVAHLPADLPEGWDCADPFPADFDRLALSGLLFSALTTASAGTLEMPFGYALTDEGLFWSEPGKDGAAARDVKLSDAFEILGEARDASGDDWALVLRFRDRDGTVKTRMIKRAALAAEAGAVRALLAAAGLLILSATGQSDRFIRFLRGVTHSRRLTLAERTGWVDSDRFVLPGEVIAGPDAEMVHFDGPPAALHYRQKGTLSGWQTSLAALAVGNSQLTFALSLGFVGPVMRWLELEGGGFHVRGASSTGKTTLGRAAGSIWGGGGPLGFASSWRATGNALEGVAHGHSETLLILDELALVDPQEAGSAAYALASGQGKARAGQDSHLRARKEWRCMVLSTGEVGLADHMRAAKRAERTMAGQELRLLDIPADAGAGLGAWERLHSLPSPAAFSDAIRTACDTNYGFAGPAFVRGLVADRRHWMAEATRLAAEFIAKVRHDGDSGQIHRAAYRFAAVAAAGGLAEALRIVPWPAGTAEAAAITCFEKWADGFGRKGLREDRQVLSKLQAAIQSNQSRFASIPKVRWQDELEDGDARTSTREGEARSLSTLGFLHDIEPGKACYLIHDAGWAEIFAGFDVKAAAQTLHHYSFLVPGESGRLKRKQRVGSQTPRFYTVCATILEWDEAEMGSGSPFTSSSSGPADDDFPGDWM